MYGIVLMAALAQTPGQWQTYYPSQPCQPTYCCGRFFQRFRERERGFVDHAGEIIEAHELVSARIADSRVTEAERNGEKERHGDKRDHIDHGRRQHDSADHAIAIGYCNVLAAL